MLLYVGVFSILMMMIKVQTFRNNERWLATAMQALNNPTHVRPWIKSLYFIGFHEWRSEFQIPLGPTVARESIFLAF